MEDIRIHEPILLAVPEQQISGQARYVELFFKDDEGDEKDDFQLFNRFLKFAYRQSFWHGSINLCL